MGVVWRARDQETGRVVALKTVRIRDHRAVIRLKSEFRMLRDVEHPNLVRLGELFEYSGSWFFTMELIEGANFLDYVRPNHLEGASFDEARLRAALRQLAAGLRALHSAGKVHRDVKPSNILVDRNDRLVVLDFGLVSDIDAFTHDEPPAGTAAYMAPEQTSGGQVTAQSDWYSFGVLLFEALTGRRPHEGTGIDVILAKHGTVPPFPSEVTPGAPADLEHLCMRLLSVSPDERPKEAEILRSLGVLESRGPTDVPSTNSTPFIGRHHEIERLLSSLRRLEDDGAAIVIIRGDSGMGKTALAREFCDRVELDQGAVVLRGRCHERESVPFKALDGVIDVLARYLGRLEDDDLRAVRPGGVTHLGHMFPSLRRFFPLPLSEAELIPDPQQLRVRAFGAFRDLVSRVARVRRLVIWIDDFQWTDADSLALLVHVMRPPRSPSLLLLVTARVDAVDAPPWLNELAGKQPSMAQIIEVNPLSPTEGIELAKLLLEHHDSPGNAHALAAESGGHPLLLLELVRGVQQLGRSIEGLRLEDVIAARISALDSYPRRILELCVIAGGPISQKVLARAAGSPEEFAKAVGVLRVASLLRSLPIRGGTMALETYHDRVREVMWEALDPVARASGHAALAAALERSEEREPEQLAIHWAGAGANAQAFRYAVEAGDRAVAAVAFDRAARAYRRAMELGGQATTRNPDLLRKLADALANGGRLTEAAEVYHQASEVADPTSALEYRRRVADCRLQAGHLESGVTVLREVLRSIGMSLPRSHRSALLALVYRRAHVRLRGLAFRERHENQIAPEKLKRIDICWSAGFGLSMFDTFIATEFQARHLMMALETGEPTRVARALTLEAGHRALDGIRTRSEVEEILGKAAELADRLNSPEAQAFLVSVRSLVAYLAAEWRQSCDFAQRAVEQLSTRCRDASWLLTTVRTFWMWSRFYLGRTREMCESIPGLLREAAGRGERYAWTAFQTGLPNFIWLIQDDPDAADASRQEAMKGWAKDRDFLLQGQEDLVARAHIALYRDDPAAAWNDVCSTWPMMRRSYLLRIEYMRNESWLLRGRCALALASRRDGREREKLLQHAEAIVRRVRRERLPWASTLARLIQAGVLAQCSQVPAAIEELNVAEQELRARSMVLYACCAQLVRGHLLADAGGRELVARATETMSAEAIIAPSRVANVLVPGFDVAADLVSTR